MKIELVMSYAEVMKVVEEMADDTKKRVQQEPDGNILVSFEPVTVAQTDFAEMVATHFDFNTERMAVESVRMLPDGGAGVVFSAKDK